MIADRKSHDWSYGRSHDATIDRTIGRLVPRLIVRSVVGSNDRSHDATIDRAIDRCTQRLIYDRPSGAPTDRALGHTTSARTIGRRMQRLILPSVAGRHDWSYDRSPRLIVRSVVGRNNWSYIGRWSLPLVARFPTMALAIDIFVLFVIARPRVDINRRMRALLDIVANIADRSHLGTIATIRTLQKSYDPVWLWL